MFVNVDKTLLVETLLHVYVRFKPITLAVTVTNAVGN